MHNVCCKRTQKGHVGRHKDFTISIVSRILIGCDIAARTTWTFQRSVVRAFIYLHTRHLVRESFLSGVPRSLPHVVLTLLVIGLGMNDTMLDNSVRKFDFSMVFEIHCPTLILAIVMMTGGIARLVFFATKATHSSVISTEISSAWFSPSQSRRVLHHQ